MKEHHSKEMAASITPIGEKSCSAKVIDIIDIDDEPDIAQTIGVSTTSIGAKSSSLNVVEIIDSDDEPDISQNVSLDMKGSGNISVATCFAEEKGKNLDNNPNILRDMQGSGNISPATCFADEKGKNLDNNHGQNNEEKLDFGEDILFAANTKRKRSFNVVMSESESDHGDDNFNNSLSTADLEVDIPMPRRRLKTLRKILSESWDDKTSSSKPQKVEYPQNIPTNVDDGELEEDLTYSEEGNISDFIVDDFDASDCEGMSNNSQDESNSDAESGSSSKDSYLQDVSDKQGSGNISLSTRSAAEKGKNFYSNYDQSNEENSDFAVIPKMKRTRNVVISASENDDLPISKLIRNHDKESSLDELVYVVDDDAVDGVDKDDDDDMPISQFIRRKKASRLRLKPQRKCVSKIHDDKVNYKPSIPTNDDTHDDDDDDESIEDLLESEGENLSGFIDDDFDVSNCEVTSSKSQDGGCNGDVDSDSNNSKDLQDCSKDSDSRDVSDDDINFGKILSKIQRKKKHKIKWGSEAYMLKEFGEDPVLCMKAVCALYRQQTSGEQMIKGTICRNGRGFNTHDAPRGSTLAVFITDGNPKGGLKKTAEEVEICTELAFHYSKQLYDIFKNKEDPFFP